MLSGEDPGGGWEILRFLPSAAGQAIQGVSSTTGTDSAGTLGWGWAALVLLAWGALFAGIGYLTTWRRDVS
jgi:hypothetical protein